MYFFHVEPKYSDENVQFKLFRGFFFPFFFFFSFSFFFLSFFFCVCQFWPHLLHPTSAWRRLAHPVRTQPPVLSAQVNILHYYTSNISSTGHDISCHLVLECTCLILILCLRPFQSPRLFIRYILRQSCVLYHIRTYWAQYWGCV